MCLDCRRLQSCKDRVKVIEGCDSDSFEAKYMFLCAWKINSQPEDLSWPRFPPAMWSLGVMSSVLIVTILALCFILGEIVLQLGLLFISSRVGKIRQGPDRSRLVRRPCTC